jgi:hypothetical protein
LKGLVAKWRFGAAGFVILLSMLLRPPRPRRLSKTRYGHHLVTGVVTLARSGPTGLPR